MNRTRIAQTAKFAKGADGSPVARGIDPAVAAQCGVSRTDPFGTAGRKK